MDNKDKFAIVKKKNELIVSNDNIIPDLISENDFFKDLTEIMEDEKFVNFFTKYMGTWLDIKSSVIYMNLYEEFKNKYYKLNKEELDKNLVVYLLTKVMRDKELRPFAIKAIDKKLDGKKIKFFKEFEKILKSKGKLLKDK